MTAPQVHPERQKRVAGALKFFSIAATITGIFLLILVVRMILEYIVGMEMPSWATYVAQAHGLAYMVYLVSILNLAPKAQWSVGKWLTTALAGVVPFLSFWMEAKRRKEVKAQFQL
ncbi:DUF3817 domain-containing protein [Corynebacterium endometrii]|uniref:DUF3817 domain-containing protein n=1 Tax=Corynebacterium endometrii TaxID=2488819 RepID=A0A4P7QJV8_9CORY|nr:DUF3817 domain-containing protein [Corynebacterium endometrii]QCB29087.1 hypothetical protein CENDO_09115 [Corynebacterium endometrii]